jgi:hypothetical protein
VQHELQHAMLPGMENKLSPRAAAAVAAYLERHGEENLLERLKLKGKPGRPPGTEHNDGAALGMMAVDVFLGRRTAHAAATETAGWLIDAEFVSLLNRKQAMETAREIGPAYDEVVAAICTHLVRGRRPDKDWRRLERKFRKRRDQLLEHVQLEIEHARCVKLNNN